MSYVLPLDLIGKTPLVYLKKISEENNCNIYLKLEKYNLTGSVKDRAVKNMLLEALKNNQINENTTIIEPTSGNTGIALASLCASLSLKCIIVMPSNANIERIKILQAYGAEIIFTRKEDKMQGSIDKVNELLEKIPNSFTLSQFDNHNNVLAHYKYTSNEIIEDLPELDGFFAVYGSGGTISGICKHLKEYNSDIKCIAVTPSMKSHRIDGIYSNIEPKNLHREYIDDYATSSDADSFKMVRELAKKEGILVGPSSGCAINGAINYIKNHNFKNIVVICADGGERYVSNDNLFLNHKYDKETIQNDFEYMYKIIKDNNYLTDEIWLKYEINENEVKALKNYFDEDAEACIKNDPSLTSLDEVINTYPGLFAIFAHRIANILWNQGKIIIAKTISEYAHSKTGIDIHPQVKIGHHFSIDHGSGIVIGQTCEIGDNVRIYHNVTLGALSLSNPQLLKDKKRHPTIKNNVIIYAGATILGGETIINDNVIIGCNTFITSSIEKNKTVSLKSNYITKGE